MKTATEIWDLIVAPESQCRPGGIVGLLEELLVEHDRELLAAFEGATPAEVRRLRAMERHFDAVILAVDSYRDEGGGRYARRQPYLDDAPERAPTDDELRSRARTNYINAANALRGTGESE